jgi:hypothetical protein
MNPLTALGIPLIILGWYFAWYWARWHDAAPRRLDKPDELTARITAWRQRTGATEAPSFPPPFLAFAEDEIAPPPCFRCLSEETPRDAPPVAGNKPSGVQWADTPAYRGVERRQQSRNGPRPVWTAAQRRLVEEDWTGTTERYLESSEGEESE